jgi:outer membrane protein TolC
MGHFGWVKALAVLIAVTFPACALPTYAQVASAPPVDFAPSQNSNVWRLPSVAASPVSQPEPVYREAGPWPAGPVSLSELIGYALANNPEIRAARYQAQALGARVPQARSLPDPTLMTTVFLEEIQTAAGPQQVAMSLAQKFPWFGKRALQSRVAYYDAMAAWSRAAAAELSVVERVKRAYFDLYFAQSAVAETCQLEKPLEDVIAVAKTKYETSEGKAGLESVFQAEVELAKLKTDLIKLEQAARQAKARLAGVLHLHPSVLLEASESLDRSRVEQKVDTLVELARQCQPAYEAWRRELARDRAAVELARRQYWPDVTTSFNWHEMGDQGLSPVANGRDAFSLGVGVNLPIYRNRLEAGVREARNKLCATARSYEADRDGFQTEIATLEAQFREHHRTFEILEADILLRAEETLRLTLQSYRAGRAGFQQLIDVYRTLLRYRVDRHRHLALSEQAAASLERAVGCAVTSREDAFESPDPTPGVPPSPPP